MIEKIIKKQFVAQSWLIAHFDFINNWISTVEADVKNLQIELHLEIAKIKNDFAGLKSNTNP